MEQWLPFAASKPKVLLRGCSNPSTAARWTDGDYSASTPRRAANNHHHQREGDHDEDAQQVHATISVVFCSAAHLPHGRRGRRRTRETKRESDGSENKSMFGSARYIMITSCFPWSSGYNITINCLLFSIELSVDARRPNVNHGLHTLTTACYLNGANVSSTCDVLLLLAWVQSGRVAESAASSWRIKIRDLKHT